MNSRQISEWQAFGDVCPYGEIRDDLRMAKAAAALAHAICGKTDIEHFHLPDPLLTKSELFLARMRRSRASRRRE